MAANMNYLTAAQQAVMNYYKAANDEISEVCRSGE